MSRYDGVFQSAVRSRGAPVECPAFANNVNERTHNLPSGLGDRNLVEIIKSVRRKSSSWKAWPLCSQLELCGVTQSLCWSHFYLAFSPGVVRRIEHVDPVLKSRLDDVLPWVSTSSDSLQSYRHPPTKRSGTRKPLSPRRLNGIPLVEC